MNQQGTGEQPRRALISVVLPVYSEHDVLPETYRRLKEALSRVSCDHELIFVDDGSRDDSASVLREFARGDAKTRVIRLSRNFGQQVAVTAGFDYASGDAVVVMDADLQDDPAMIPEFVRKWQEGYEVVYNVRGKRSGLSPARKLGTNAFYGLIRRVSDVQIPQQVGLYRLMDRKVIQVLRSMRETNRFLPGLFAWVGFRQIGLASDRPERAGGEAKSLGKLIALGLDGIISFSYFPLRLALWVGLVVSALSFLLALALIILKLADPARPLFGWTSIIVAVLFLGGLQLVFMGIIGEYVGRLYDEAKRRPLYVVGEAINFDPAEGQRR